MALQSLVGSNIGGGSVGEKWSESSVLTARAFQIASAGTTNPNRVGRAFTMVNGSDNQVNVGGTIAAGTAFAGILGSPKMYALYGVSGNTLGSSLDLPQGTQAAFVQICPGGLWVNFENAGNIGDYVDYDTTTGQLYTRPYGNNTVPAGRNNIPNAIVWAYNLTSAGLGVIRISA